MFRTDRPIQSSRDDILGRSTFAEALGKAILGYREQESIVVGLFGPWGSGKTSIVNMFLEHISQAVHDIPEDRQPIVIHFNPWIYSDQGQIVSQYFKQVAAVLQRPGLPEEVREAGVKLALYGSFFQPLTVQPTVGMMAAALSRVLHAEDKSAASQLCLEEPCQDMLGVREELRKALGGLNRKILVVIDDVDRLNNTEIRQIFQLVKMLGDFPSFMYVLVFDKTVILSALRKVQEGRGDDYLEKVIQIPFEVPLISRQEIEYLLFEQLHRIMRSVPDSRWNQTAWGNIYHAGLKSFFRHIRDVIRYVNTLRFSFDLVRDDVDPVDFLAIAAVQVFFPGVYSGIRDNKSLFAGICIGHAAQPAELEKSRTLCNRILDQAPEEVRGPLLDVLKRLFPRLRTIYGSTAYGRDWLESWRKERRICSPDIFDVYFRLSFPRQEVSPRDMEEILALAEDRMAFTETLVRLHDNGKIVRFLEHLEDYGRSDVPRENIDVVIEALLDLGDHFPQSGSGFFGTDTPRRITRICCMLGSRIRDREERYRMLLQAVENAESSLYTLIHLVVTLEQQHAEAAGLNEVPVVEEEQAHDLRNRVLERIRAWAEDGRLAKSPRLAAILPQWLLWEEDDAVVLDYTARLVESDVGLLDLVSAFLVRPSEGGMSNFSGTLHPYIDRESLGIFVDLDAQRERLERLRREEYHCRLDQARRLALDCLLEEDG